MEIRTNAESKKRPARIVSLLLSAIIMMFLMSRALYVRINVTGWENFPTTMLDFFAIAGSLLMLPLIVFGIYTAFKIGRKAVEIPSNTMNHH